MLALRGLFATKGIPNMIISDNFKAFKTQSVKIFCKINSIKWKFILERSPWCGEFYERLITIVKNSLKKIVGRASLTYDEIHT